MTSLIKLEIESVELEDSEGGSKILKLPELTETEKDIIDPIIAPTSGLRIQICDIIEENKKYYIPNRKFFLFLRVFKAISQHYIEIKGNQNLKILIVTDDRPSKNLLLQYCSEIFAYNGFQIYHQQDSPK